MTGPTPTIREALLELIFDLESNRQGGNLQEHQVLDTLQRRLIPHGDNDKEAAILTEWHELFRTGLLDWGYNLSNSKPPFFRLTGNGHRAMENAARDPSNPAG